MANNKVRGRSIWIIAVAAIAVIGAAAGWYLNHAPRPTPAGQPALQSLASGNLDSLHQAFDNASSRLRILVMLSPT